jgi:DNA-binding response OmpR family regulator
MSRTDPVPLPAVLPSVLIVEDDPTIGHHLHLGLQGHGYPTTWCRTGGAALIHATETKPGIVLLDLGLPDLDGVELARRIRHDDPEILLIILTARSAEIDVIVGLDAGADDYLVKPFSLTVLLARLRAHLRRRPISTATETALQLGALTIDLASRRCHIEGSDLALRPKEFDLLAALAAHPGAAVSREQLMSEVLGRELVRPNQNPRCHDGRSTSAAQRRRSRSPHSDLALPTVTTLRGYGYRLDAPRSEQGSAQT